MNRTPASSVIALVAALGALAGCSGTSDSSGSDATSGSSTSNTSGTGGTSTSSTGGSSTKSSTTGTGGTSSKSSTSSTGGSGGAASGGGGQAMHVGGGGSGTGGSGGAGAGGSGAGGSLAVCDASGPGSHPTCTGATCPIALDVVLRCTDRAFADYGLHVAPTATFVAVSVASPDQDRFARIDASGTLATNEMPFTGLPDQILLATAPDGTLGATADETAVDGFTNPISYPGGLAYVTSTDGTTFTHVAVADRVDGYIPPVDFDFAPDGTPNIFYNNYPHNRLATLAGGTFSSQTLTTTNTGYERFGLALSGEPLVIDFAQHGGGGYTMKAIVGTAAPVVLSTTVTDDEAEGVHPVQVPTGDAPPGSPAFAVVTQRADAMVLRWPDASGPAAIAFANSPPLASQCMAPNYPACMPNTCTDNAVGVVANAFAAARTTDGAAWVAYVLQHTSRDLAYAPNSPCGGDGSPCDCASSITRDTTTWDLHVERALPGGATPTEVLSLPIAYNPGETTDGTEPFHAVDMRAVGTDVALAVRLAEGTNPTVRVLRLQSP